MKTRLIATKPYSYGGRSLKTGQEFEAKGPHAKVLVGIGRATYSTRVLTAEPQRTAPAKKTVPRAARAPAAKTPAAKTVPTKPDSTDE